MGLADALAGFFAPEPDIPEQPRAAGLTPEYRELQQAIFRFMLGQGLDLPGMGGGGGGLEGMEPLLSQMFGGMPGATAPGGGGAGGAGGAPDRNLQALLQQMFGRRT